eukprot:2876060-Prymnesium_polylepis.1
MRLRPWARSLTWQLWVRVLDDDSQTTAAFIASWFARVPGRWAHTPPLVRHALMLLRWAGCRLTGSLRAARSDALPPPVAYDEAPVAYEELGLGDVMRWASWGAP